MLAVCLISLLVELLNSAIEATIDRISLEIHPLSKKAKDMGSAAQTFALITVAIVWEYYYINDNIFINNPNGDFLQERSS